MTTATIDDELLADAAAIPEPESAPRRGPGRPRKDGSAPGSGARATGTAKRAPKRISVSELKKSLAMLVGGLNLAITLSRFKDDALTDAESDLLVDALHAEATASARVMSWLERAAGITPHVLLIRAAFEIITPRLARRGLIPGFVETIPEHDPAECDAARASGWKCPIHSDPDNVIHMKGRN